MQLPGSPYGGADGFGYHLSSSKSINTIDNLYAAAKKTVQQARELNALVEKYDEDLPDW